LALIDTGAADKDAAAKTALERGEAWLLEHLPKLRRANSIAIYNVWGHAYGIQALVDLYRRESRDEKRRQQIKEVILTQIDLLRRYESVDGGWGYYDFRVGAKRPATDSTSFLTATVLIAFHAAKNIGVEIPEDVLNRGIASINRQEKNDHSYLYGEYLRWQPMMPINRPGGSLGRSQACNLALRLWGDKTITKASSRIGWTDWSSAMKAVLWRKRPIPHESWFQVAGYFLLLRPLLCRALHRTGGGASARRYKDYLAAILMPTSRKRRFLVGFSALQLPSTIRHRVCLDDASPLSEARAVSHRA